jgi:hypothetical protein
MASRRKNPETELQNQIMNFLNKIPGVACWRNSIFKGRMPSGSWARAGLPTGSADLILCVEGNFAGIEVKCPGEEATEEQKDWGDEVAQAGGVYGVAHCIKEAVEIINPLLTTPIKCLS